MPAPTLDEVRAWINVPATVLSDPQLAQVIAAETLLQARACRVPDDPALLPEHLAQAILRRVAREVAARGVPLGLLGADAEYGPMRLSKFDGEIERLEGPDRRVIFG